MSFTITDTLANAFNTGEVSLNVYAFTPDTFGGQLPQHMSAAPTTLAAATATADSNGKFSLTVLTESAYHLAAQSVLNPTTWYWSYSHLVDGGDTVADTTTGQHLLAGSYGTAPTVAANANNGTSPPTPTLATGATDERGIISFGSGSGSPAAGTQVTLTFGKAFAAAPAVAVTPLTDATEVLGVSATTTTTALNIVVHTAATASQSVGTYKVAYEVIG